jgi:hypothetical protein
VNYLTLASDGRILATYSILPENLDRVPVPDGCSVVEASRLPVGTDNYYIDGAFTYVAPPDPPAPNLDELKAAKSDAVTVARDSVINGGFTFNSVRYQTRPDDRENIAGAVQLATLDVIPPDFVWIAEDNSLVPMDVATIKEFGTAAAAFKSAAIFYARGLKDAIAAAADEAALSAIDINTGWPT